MKFEAKDNSNNFPLFFLQVLGTVALDIIFKIFQVTDDGIKPLVQCGVKFATS